MRIVFYALISALIVSGCAKNADKLPKPVICEAETIEVQVPVPTPIPPSPALCAFKVTPDLLPVFVAPSDRNATSALTTEGELKLKLLISRFQQAVIDAKGACPK